MALSASTLSGLIKAQLTAQFGAPESDEFATKFCDAVAAAVVTHIQAAGQVNGGVVTVAGVVTSGAGSGGAVTATGAIANATIT
jgi:hypothetical protein